MTKILPGWNQAINSLPRLHKHLQTLTRNALPPLPPIRPELSETVFTHKSFFTEGLHRSGFEHPPGRNEKTYDVFETYGDACLELAVTDILQAKFPNLSKSGHTNMRSALVQNRTLGAISTVYGLPKRFRTGEHQRAEVLSGHVLAASVFEAYTWAIMLEHGYTGAKEWIRALLEEASQKVYEDLKAT